MPIPRKKIMPPNKIPLDTLNKTEGLTNDSTPFGCTLADTLKCPITVNTKERINNP